MIGQMHDQIRAKHEATDSFHFFEVFGGHVGSNSDNRLRKIMRSNDKSKPNERLDGYGTTRH